MPTSFTFPDSDEESCRKGRTQEEEEEEYAAQPLLKAKDGVMKQK